METKQHFHLLPSTWRKRETASSTICTLSLSASWHSRHELLCQARRSLVFADCVTNIDKDKLNWPKTVLGLGCCPEGHLCHIMFHVDAPAQKLELYLKVCSVRFFFLIFFSSTLQLCLAGLFMWAGTLFTFVVIVRRLEASTIPKVIILKVFICRTHTHTLPAGLGVCGCLNGRIRNI